MAFTQDSDPIKDLGIGCSPHLEKTLKELGINVSVEIEDKKLTIIGNIDLINKKRKNGEIFAFNDLLGLFSIVVFKELVIKGNFWIDRNKLTSLKGCPTEVYGSFSCTGNPLKNLDGLPKVIKGNVWIV